MSIFSWLKQVASGDTAIQADINAFAENEELFHGLNMKEALDAHVKWTHRLEGKLAGENDEPLDVATVASDCECVLGKWLHGPAKHKYGELSDYEALRRTHAEFHLQAGEILNNVINGEAEEAKNNLKTLRFQSGNVQLALVRLYSHTQS